MVRELSERTARVHAGLVDAFAVATIESGSEMELVKSSVAGAAGKRKKREGSPQCLTRIT